MQPPAARGAGGGNAAGGAEGEEQPQASLVQTIVRVLLFYFVFQMARQQGMLSVVGLHPLGAGADVPGATARGVGVAAPATIEPAPVEVRASPAKGPTGNLWLPGVPFSM